MVGAVKEAASDRTEKLLGTYSAPILAASVGGLIIWLRQFGGITGLGVDAASGAINKYPDQITVEMTLGPSFRQPPGTPSRPKPQRTSGQ